MFEKPFIRLIQNILSCKYFFYLYEWLGLRKNIPGLIYNTLNTEWKEAKKWREAWEAFNARFIDEYNKLKDELKDAKFDLPILGSTLEDLKEPLFNGKAYKNRNTIELYLGPVPTPISFTSYREGKKSGSGGISEIRGALVFSQAHTGEVALILYPSVFDFEQDKRQYRLIKLYKSPEQITRQAIRYYFFRCILYSFETSYFGHMSMTTRLQQFYVDHKDNIYLVVLGGAIGFIASVLATILLN